MGTALPVAPALMLHQILVQLLFCPEGVVQLVVLNHELLQHTLDYRQRKQGSKREQTSQPGKNKASITHLVSRALRSIQELMVPQTQTQSGDLFLQDRDAS